MGRRLKEGPLGALNTITPCAACKLLRRRCAQECPFSPYFSPHEPHKFASVHKEVPEPQRADAANSLVYEANLRLRDPVYGCMGAISALQQQVQALEAELQAVRTEILRHKYRPQTTSHSASTLISPSGEVPVAVRPAPATVQTRTSPQPPVPAADANSSSSIYTTSPPSTSTNYSSLTGSHNVAYFG